MNMLVEPAAMALSASQRAVHREVQIMGSTTHYWTYKAKTASRGTIIVLHGYRGAHDGLEGVIGGLEDFDCIAPDLPGYGITAPLNARHSIATYDKWLGEFIKAMKLPVKPFVLGHSFATIVISAHAASSNDMSDIVLLNPVSKPGLKGPRRFISAITEAFFWVASKLPERGARRMMDNWLLIQALSWLMAKSRDKNVRKWVHQQHHSTLKDYANCKVMFECYHASVHHCVEEYASSIKNRTLMIAGGKDDITSAKQQLEVSKKLSNATLVVFPEVGHLTHYESTKQVGIEATKFLSKA
jgi:pimeloyl-ACP methyl ester carboxylesterase